MFDKEHRRKLAFNILQYDKKVEEGKHQFADFDTARHRASTLKWRITENLDKYLIEFEANFIKRGGKVIWAQDGEEAMTEIIKIMKNANAFDTEHKMVQYPWEIFIKIGLMTYGP